MVQNLLYLSQIEYAIIDNGTLKIQELLASVDITMLSEDILKTNHVTSRISCEHNAAVVVTSP